MNFLRSKAGLIITIIMCGLCITAIGLSVRVSLMSYERQSQVIKNMPVEEVKHEAAKDNFININKLTEQAFYFNGKKLEGVRAYMSDKNQCFIPLDEILAQIKQKFNFFSSDDLLETNVNGSKILVKLGKNLVQMGSGEVKLPAAPVAARDHVLVPIELFQHIYGFSTNVYGSKNAVFLNYYPDFNDKANTGVKVLRLVNGVARISDIFSSRLLWDRHGSYTHQERFIQSDNGFSTILKSGDKTYVIKYGSTLSPRPVNVDASATLSLDGKYLYWTGSDRNAPYLYDIGTGKLKKPWNELPSINSDYGSDTSPSAASILYDYKEGNGYKRIALTDPFQSFVHTFIERNRKLVLQGKAAFSPDRTKVLYYRPGQGYMLANANGAGTTLLGQGTDAKWVNNNKVFLQTSDAGYIFNSKEKNKFFTSDPWNMAGQTPKGDILFMRNQALYIEKEGNEQKIGDLPGKCDYASALSAEGPYIAVTDQEFPDGVFLIRDGNVSQIGKASALLMDINEKGIFRDLKNSISFSPNNQKAILFQRENGFMTLQLMDNKLGTILHVYLDEPLDSSFEAATYRAQWISDDRLVVYTAARGWIVDCKDDVKIYGWKENSSGSAFSSIEGIVP